MRRRTTPQADEACPRCGRWETTHGTCVDCSSPVCEDMERCRCGSAVIAFWSVVGALALIAFAWIQQ